MILSRYKSAASSFAIAMVAFGSSQTVYAQDGGSFTLEEIIVTAQKRSESLQQVPVSVSVITGDKIRAQGIARAEELSSFVPNFSIQQDPIGDKINIRGIQSGNNAGLEQSVASFVDGVYRGRGVQARFAFLDVERIEVLRGPQGALFGKNTIGGALNITASKPTNVFEAELNGSYAFENIDEYEASGYVSGPLGDKVRARGAFLYRNLDEGHLRNVFYDTRTPTLEEYAFRGTVEWDASPDTLITLRAEYGDFDLFGQPFGNLVPGPLALFGVEEGRFDITNMGSVNPVLDIGSNGNQDGDVFEIALTGDHSFDAGTLTFITAYSEYDFIRELDADFSPLDLVRFDDGEDFEQFSAEVRFASDTGGRFEYLLGGYFQHSELVADGVTFFNVRGEPGEVAVDTLLQAGCAAAGGDPSDRNCILTGLVTGFDGTPLAFQDFNRVHFLDQEGDVYAVFGEATWNFTDTLGLTFGARFTHEDKDGTQGAFAADFGTLNRNDSFAADDIYAQFGAPSPFAAIAEAQTHENELSRSEDSFTWSAKLKWYPTDDVLLYGSAATGFKAGGFNSFALSADPAEAEFEEEEVIGGEIGSKMTLFDGVAELNIAAFYTDFKDLQTALFTGSTSFIVQNAASATSRGLEIDGRWAITENLRLNGGIAYVDFEFDSFPNAGCTVDQLLAFRDEQNAPLATLQDCSAAGVNDLSGRTSENTPKWSGSFSANHFQEVFDGYEISTTIDLNFQTKQFRQADLDPALLDDAFVKINAIISFGPQDGDWLLSIIAKNLNDAKSFSYGNDTPLVDGARQFIPDRPRTIAVRATARF